MLAHPQKWTLERQCRCNVKFTKRA